MASIIFAIALIVSFPQNAIAKDDLIVSQWVVEANLLETGDLGIVEEITYEFNDDFNGIFREIIVNKTSGVSDIQVQELINDDPREYTLVEDAEKGDSNVFLIKDEAGKTIVQIFSPSEDEEKTFRISYLVKNVAVKYNDIGELYYKFLGDENETPIESFAVNIKLPQADTNNQVKVFAHGPLNGKIAKENNTTYSLYVEDVPDDTFIEGRILFPREFIHLSNNVQNIDNYFNILEEEAAFQNKLAEDREREEKIRKTLEQASNVASRFGFIIFLIFLVRFRREKNIYQSEAEGTNIPEDCTPAIAAQLTNTIIGTNTVFATILDLFRKGYIKINKEKDKLGQNADDQEFLITLVKKEDNYLLNHEKIFINWFINEMGNRHSVSTREIEEFNKHNSSEFLNLYYEWKKKIKEDAVLKGYYDKSKTKFGVFFLIFSLLLFVLGMFTIIYGSLFGLAGIFVSIILFIYSFTLFYRLSDLGYHQYKKWSGFKKYMKKHQKDLSKGDAEKYSSDISLIYALGLGVNKKTEDLNFAEVASANVANESYANSWLVWYLLFVNHENNVFQRSIDSSFHDTTDTHSGGGGFSGGGGGGAGGGGTGGF